MFLRDGTGHFTGSTAAASTFSQGLAAGDFNGDGNLDIAGGDVYSNQLHILLGNGAGGFTASTVPAAANSAAIVTADLNGDGKLDLAVVPSSAFSGENFYLGNGNGGFTAGGFGTAFPQPNYLAVADFNGDGLLDVATLSTSGPLAIDTQSLVTPVTLTFVTQPLFTTSMSQLVTLTNTSTASLNLSSVVVTGDFVQTNTCGTSLASGATCQINVSFRPTGRGNRTGLLTITDDASSSPQTVALNGIGTAFTLSPNVLSFGGVKVGDTRVQTATIANVAKSNLHIISVVPDGDLTYYSIGTDCKKTIAPSASCTVTIRYSPQMLIVDRATLTFNEDGGDGSQVLTFSGNGRN